MLAILEVRREQLYNKGEGLPYGGTCKMVERDSGNTRSMTKKRGKMPVPGQTKESTYRREGNRELPVEQRYECLEY